MKDKITKATNDTKTASKNFVRLVESVSLLVVAAYTMYGGLNYVKPNTWLQVALLFAASVIALRGAWEFFRYLARKD